MPNGALNSKIIFKAPFCTAFDFRRMWRQTLVDHLNLEWGRLESLGIAENEIEHHCRAFALAAWAIMLRACDHEGVA
jgi:hypothetical protein